MSENGYIAYPPSACRYGFLQSSINTPAGSRQPKKPSSPPPAPSVSQ